MVQVITQHQVPQEELHTLQGVTNTISLLPQALLLFQMQVVLARLISFLLQVVVQVALTKVVEAVEAVIGLLQLPFQHKVIL
jgi:hypothetical protein